MEVALDEEGIRCENAECRVAIDRKCIEGIPEPASCMHYGKSVVVVQRAKPVAAPTEPSGIRLSSAEALSMPEAQVLIRQRAASVIGIVGPQDAGKTSLIAGMYDLFQRNKVGNFAFAGSNTLYAFERACHDSRRESGNRYAGMERTGKGAATFLHLDLASDASREKRAILLANRAGEDYTDAQSDTTLANSFYEIRRADTLTMLVDGERLLDVRQRQQVRDDILVTLRALVEGGATLRTQRVAVVLTKVDAIRAADEAQRARAETFFLSIVKDAKQQFAGNFLDIQSFEIAASPKGGATPRGEGMEEVLRYWMKQPGRDIPQRIPLVKQTGGRVFGRLTQVQPKAQNG